MTEKMKDSIRKAAHSLGVGKLMYYLAKEKGWKEEKCQEMFVLGYLHDVGYEFTDNEYHALTGAEILAFSDYKYCKEIMFHGSLQKSFCSEELDLLNIADLHIDSNGNFVSIRRRLKDIAERYGIMSSQHKTAYLLAKQLKQI